MQIRVLGCLALVSVPLALCLSAEAGAPHHPKLRILSGQPLPPALAKSVDIRWASDSSVYLAMMKEGTVEISLAPLAAQVKEIIPGGSKPGGFWGSSRLAVSKSYLAVAAPIYSVTWRKPEESTRKEEGGFDSIEDIDVHGSQALILGVRRGEKREYAPDGGIAWLGSLKDDLKDLRAVLFDATGPGARNFANCANLGLGAVRFLPDGSFVAIPGVQPGAQLYDNTGKLIRSWDTLSLGLTADCPKLSREEARRINLPEARVGWLNQRQTLDDILPLREGPGLVIRRVVNGKVRWHLRLLATEGEARTFEIPIEPQNEMAHLRGDVREGRIVFLVYAWKADLMGTLTPRVVIAELSGQPMEPETTPSGSFR